MMTKEKPYAFITKLIIFIYFISGACSLIYEVIWRRLLKLILGNTTYATSITVAVFLGGLALGAFLIRNRVDKTKINKLKLYGIIEIIISCYTLLTPLLLNNLDYFYKFIYRAYAPSSSTILFLQIIFSVVVLLIPTILMGFTLPILTSWIASKKEYLSSTVGIIYSFNTFGALLGAFISGFYLIRLTGVYETLYIAVLFNFLIGIVALFLSPMAGHQTYEEQSLELNKDAPVKFNLQLTFVSVGIFICGFVGLGYEILWMRTILHILSSEIYVFSAVLSIYLVGYALGVYLGSALIKKTTNYFFITGIIIQLIGIYGVLYIPFLNMVVFNPAPWFKDLIIFTVTKFGPFIHLLYGFQLFFIPSVLMVMSFPLLIQLFTKADKRAGNIIATAYSINTFGNVLGSLLVAFLLIPLLGSQLAKQVLGLISILTGLLFMFYANRLYAKIISVCILSASLIITFTIPKNAYLKHINRCEGKGRPVSLLDVIEGINTTASVHFYQDTKSKVISTGGLNVAGDSSTLRQTQKVQGHIPLIMHGNPKDVLTVGFGSGELTRCLSYHNIPKVSCVEIAPEMVKLSLKHFDYINLGPDLEKKVNMIYMDAKNYIHLTDKKYDVIMNDSIWPGASAESSSLYTKEYFIDGKNILNNDGVYSTWVPIQMSRNTLKSIIRTFIEVFENPVLIYPHSYFGVHFLLVGQKNAHKYSYLDMKREYNKAEVKQSLKYVNIENINHIIEYIFTDYPSLKEFTKDAPINSDYYPFVEFDDERRKSLLLYPNNPIKNIELLLFGTKRINYSELLSFSGLTPSEIELIENDLRNKKKANSFLFLNYLTNNPEQRRKYLFKGLLHDPNNPDLLNEQSLLERQLRH